MIFRRHIRAIVIFSAIVLALLMAQRTLALIVFGHWSDLQGSVQFLPAFLLRSLRFDVKFVAALLLLLVWLPAIIFSLMPERWFSHYLSLVFKLLLIVTTYIIFVDLGYLYYFQKPIDVLIFGFLQDDTAAILTLMLDNLLLVLLFAGFILFCAILLKVFTRLSLSSTSRKIFSQPKTEIISWFLSLLVLFVLARGSVDTFPLQRKHASVSDNRFLNSLVMNSPFNLYYAWRDYRVNNQQIFRQDLLKQNELNDYQTLLQRAGYDEQQPLIRTTAADASLDKLRPHVIFVQMEGWSAYIARKHSRENNVLGEFAQHAREDHFFTRFFSNKYATNPTIESLLLNSPITPLSQSIAKQTRFSLFNVQPYIEKGYQTLFLSGGYSSWRNHNRFWLNQGFDRYIGRSRIESTFNVDASDNPWGVYDEYVFKYLQHSLLEADRQQKPLFSFVLTTNNHPPVRLPASFETPKLQPQAYGFEPDDEAKKQILSGFFYQTDQLGRFISWLKNSALKDRVIIVATGDHPLRQFVKKSALKNQYTRYGVATYLYVPESLDKLKSVSNDVAGSHNDLFPTLFELSLSDARYYNFGTPLMEKKMQDAYGWSSHGKFIFRQGVGDDKRRQLYQWQDEDELWLNPQPLPLADWELQIMDEEFYRKILKQYLLVKDFRQQS